MQRYFVSFDNWRNDSSGCVFFYLGNEADVSLCALCTAPAASREPWAAA
jgi:hypothetical protein